MSHQTVLLVEDEDIIAGFIEHVLTDDGLRVLRVADAEHAWTLLTTQADEIAGILLDRQLPGMDGLALLQRIKQEPRCRDIPVIMETGVDDADSIREGLAAGAYYYLTKPLDPRLLHAVVTAALAQHAALLDSRTRLHERVRALDFLRQAEFSCRTLAEAHELAHSLASLCPHPERAAFGLQELLVNAIEHGNLELGYEDKTRLLLEDGWDDEVALRLAHADYAQRSVHISLQRRPQETAITISDQGHGFDWRHYLELEAERAFDPHGRGIAMSRMMSFDSLEYQGCGNIVTVVQKQHADS